MTGKLDPLFSSDKMDWETPDDFFQYWNRALKFTLDGAANETNHKVDRWCGPGGIAEDGLFHDWQGEIVWLNPPYGRELPKWVEKARVEGTKSGTIVICLIPARTDTKWAHDNLWQARHIFLLKGHLKFVGAEHSAPFPSMIVYYDGDWFNEGDRVCTWELFDVRKQMGNMLRRINEKNQNL